MDGTVGSQRVFEELCTAQFNECYYRAKGRAAGWWEMGCTIGSIAVSLFIGFTAAFAGPQHLQVIWAVFGFVAAFGSVMSVMLGLIGAAQRHRELAVKWTVLASDWRTMRDSCDYDLRRFNALMSRRTELQREDKFPRDDKLAKTCQNKVNAQWGKQ